MMNPSLLTAPEILCPYCNAPNPRGLPSCITCGIPLSGATASARVAPLVGREPLLLHLRQDVETVRRFRRGRFIVVEGEAGMGKSRLARELVAELWGGEVRVFMGRAYADKQSTSYWLLSDILFHFFRLDPTMTSEERRTRIQSTLTELLGVDAVRHSLPPLLWLFNLATEGEAQDMAEIEPEQRQQRLFRALQALFLGATTQQPIVLIVDDAHWSDSVSVEFLTRLLNKRVLLRLLLVALARPDSTEERERPLNRLLALNNPDTTYTLEPLDEGAARSLLEGLLLTDELPSGLHELLLPRSQGNPYLLEELTHTLVERGVLLEEDGAWRYDPKRGSTVALLPLTVQATVKERLGHLTPPARCLLEVAAVMGTRLEREVLLQATDSLNLGWKGSELEKSLSVLGQRNFLVGEEGNHLRFRHNLMQEIVLHNTDDAHLTGYHGAIAQALEKVYRGRLTLVIQRLALHYGQSDNAERALHYLNQVGQLAVGYFAAEQASYFFYNALKRFPDELARQPELFLTYGNLLKATGNYDEARKIFELALQMTGDEDAARFQRQIGAVYSRQARYNDAERIFGQALKRIAPGDEAMRASLFAEMGWVRYQQGRLDEAEDLYEEALALFGYTDAPARAQVLNRMAGIAFRRGDYSRAHDILTRAMDALAEAGDLQGIAGAHNNLGSIYTYQGNFKGGIEHRQQALELYERLGDTEGQTYVQLNLAELYTDLGRFADAYPLAEHGLNLARESGQRYEECFALTLLGWVRAHQGDLLMGQEWLAESREIAKDIGALDKLFGSTVRLAEVMIYYRAFNEAEALVEELFASNTAPEFAPDLWRLRAILARHQGQLDEATRTIRSSLDLHEQTRAAPFSYLLSEVEHMEILQAQGNTALAEACRAQALQRWQQVSSNAPLLPHIAAKLQGESAS